MDHYQISVYFMLPLTILAGGAIASLKIKPLYTYILTATAIIASLLPISPAEAYLNSQMDLWQSQDKEVRALAQKLPDDTSIMGNPPHILIAMPEHKPVRKFLPKMGSGMENLLEKLDGFACFEPSDSPGSCAFTEELFPSKAGAFLLEPTKFGFVQKSKIKGILFNLVIYENSRNQAPKPGDKL